VPSFAQPASIRLITPVVASRVSPSPGGMARGSVPLSRSTIDCALMYVIVSLILMFQ
jgi:hypothetical protein